MIDSNINAHHIMKDSKEIRQQLKNELGFNAKQVSVRVQRHGTITFTIRDTQITFEDVLRVREFAKQFESIRRCEITHEILSGGNTFVYVETTDEVDDALTAALRPLIAHALRVKQVESYGTKIEGLDDCVLWKSDYYTCSVSVEGTSGFGLQCYCDTNNERNFNSAVKSMAISVLEQRARVEADKQRRAEDEAADAKRAEEVALIQQNDDSNIIDLPIGSSDVEAHLLADISIAAANVDVDRVIELTDLLQTLRHARAVAQQKLEALNKAQRAVREADDALAQLVAQIAKN